MQELNHLEPTLNRKERFEVGMPYIVPLELPCNEQQADLEAPTTEQYQAELQKFLDNIAERGGRLVTVFTGKTLLSNGVINFTSQMLVVVGDDHPEKLQVVLPEFEKGKKTQRILGTVSINWPVSVLTKGLITPTFHKDSMSVSTLLHDDWQTQMTEFFNSLDGVPMAEVIGRTMDRDGSIEERRFILVS